MELTQDEIQKIRERRLAVFNSYVVEKCDAGTSPFPPSTMFCRRESGGSALPATNVLHDPHQEDRTSARALCNFQLRDDMKIWQNRHLGNSIENSKKLFCQLNIFHKTSVCQNCAERSSECVWSGSPDSSMCDGCAQAPSRGSCTLIRVGAPKRRREPSLSDLPPEDTSRDKRFCRKGMNNVGQKDASVSSPKKRGTLLDLQRRKVALEKRRYEFERSKLEFVKKSRAKKVNTEL